MTDVLASNGILGFGDSSLSQVEQDQEEVVQSNEFLAANEIRIGRTVSEEEGAESLAGNGLLGQPGPEEVEPTSNGLLGGDAMDVDDDDDDGRNLPPSSFSNGLLDSTSVDGSDTFEPSSGQPQSGLVSTLKHIPEAGLPTSGASPTRLPPAFEAVTNDGRSVKFGRRERKKGTNGVVVNGGGNLMAPRPQASSSYQLLSTPIHLLLKEIQDDSSLLLARSLQEEQESEARSLLQSKNGSATAEKIRGVMWVDKYRPKKFTELLGEERTNRDVLSWLKEWDKCVFKRTYQKKKKPWEENPLSSSTAPNSAANSSKPPFGAFGSDQAYAYHDQLGRPKDRILLMSGPPGMGKTTLAHVVAKAAGYSVLEINASDDRTASTVSSRIQNAIDAGSGLHAKGKPTCVIIDEIDGAVGAGDGGFIRMLITLIQDKPASKKNKTPAKVLRRPIICICNDLYATPLRHLRPFARVVRFKKSQPLTMVNRMREICEREGLKADTRSLTALVEVTNNDVRSCLNTLQFIKAKSGEVNEKSIRSSSVGMKDAGTSVHAVWSSLFVPKSTKQKRTNGRVDDGRYVSKMAFDVQACGEYDRIVQGCFEHYPILKPLDPMFKSILKVHDWVHFHDRLSSRVSSSQEFELMGYMPYAIVPWHSHLASIANADRPVEFPKADYETYLTATANREVATSLSLSIPPSLRGLYTMELILTELAPMMMRIISPALKPMNATLVKVEEKETLKRLVDLMIDLNLRFVRDKNEDGQPMFRVEPAIDVFIHYEGKRASDVQISRFAIRQLVSQAIEAELIKRRGANRSGGVGGAGAGRIGSGKESYAMFGQSKGQGEDKIDLADRPTTDFFGRAVVKKAEPAPTGTFSALDGITSLRSKQPFRVMYKFNEGSSSAVRKPVKMSSLM